MEVNFENVTLDYVISNNLTSEPIYTPEYIYTWVTVVNAVIFLTGCVGNILVITVVAKVNEMRTPTNYCLVNLSVADLLVLTICQTSAMLEFYAEDRWLLGEVLCRTVPFLEALVTHASILIMMGISFGRYYAVCRPLQSYSTYSRTRTLFVMFWMWVVAALSAIPFIVMTSTEEARFHRDGSFVKVCRTRIYHPWHYIFLIVIFWVFCIIPLFILIVIYTRIIHRIVADSEQIDYKNDNMRRHCLRSRKQLVSMIIAIVVLFFICVLPMRILVMWLTFADSSQVKNLGLENYLNVIWFARVMLYLNSAGNPIIYNVFSGRFRNAFKTVLCINGNRLMSRASQRTLSNTRYSFVRKDTGEKEDKL